MTQVQVDDKEKPWLLFHGPSGCGKTVAATHEVRKALDGLGVAQTTIYKALTLRASQLASTPQEKVSRNDHALTFLSNLIPQCDSTNTSSLILVFDECTADIDLMRGIVASHVEARALAADRGYCHLLVVFAGIALPSALNQTIISTNVQTIAKIELHAKDDNFFMDVFLSSAKRTFNFSDETCQELSLHKGLRDIWLGVAGQCAPSNVCLICALVTLARGLKTIHRPFSGTSTRSWRLPQRLRTRSRNTLSARMVLLIDQT